MHVHVFSFPFWMIILVIAVALKHRRRMEAMRLGLGDRWTQRRLDRASRLRGRFGDDDESSANRLDNAERSELQDLRQRVRVLERIATDNHSSRDLADEIEALRDRPVPAARQEESK